jgi:hypothetical protein
MEWRFFIKHEFSGSDNNQTRVYITADGPSTSYSGTGSAGVSGYFLLFGEALSNDVIRFYYDDGSSTNLIASGTTSIAGSFQASVRVTRDASANWAIQADFNGGSNYSTEAAINDNSSNTSNYFGFINKYTTSNSNNISFDNFYVGAIEVDTTAPGVLSVTPTSLSTIDVLFNESVNTTTASNAANYTIVNIGNALNAAIDANNSALVQLTHSEFSKLPICRATPCHFSLLLISIFLNLFQPSMAMLFSTKFWPIQPRQWAYLKLNL